MRTFLSGLSVLLCGLLLIGAVGLNAPVMQSRSYYINDHAGVIEEENRDNMLKTAQTLYENTGVRAVLLTIESLDGRTPEEYAELIFRSWEIGAGGIGILVLLSTEEKRFATWSNADISIADAIAEGGRLAAEGRFDPAAANCFMAVVDSIYGQAPFAEGAKPESNAPKSADSAASVTNAQESKASNPAITFNAQGAERNQSREGKDILILLLLLVFIFISMRARTRSMKLRKRVSQSENIYLRKTYSYEDEPIAVRIDDVDYPSGFGGPGNRKAIYFEDVDAADDIGIIKRRSSGRSDAEAMDGGAVK